MYLSEKNSKALYIPEGFGHAYYSFSKLNVIYYKLSNYYHPEYEDGILWNDKSLKFKWPTKNPVISPKDKKLKTFIDFKTVYKGLKLIIKNINFFNEKNKNIIFISSGAILA